MLNPSTSEILAVLMGGGGAEPAWTRDGVVLTATVAGDQTNVYEPTVIYEAAPQILEADSCFKMWYTQGWATTNICYAESLDGKTWTKYASNPVLSGHSRSSVFKNGETYYMVAALTNGAQLDMCTSADGVTWAVATAAIIPKGGVGTWDANYVANSFVWIEGTTWYMLYEAKGTVGGNIWKIGLATSADGATWTKSESNPVLTFSGMIGGPWVKKSGSTYYLWCHRNPKTDIAKVTPTDIDRYTSTDLVTWTQYALTDPAFPRQTTDEGYNTSYGQIADAFILEHGGRMYLYYSATKDGGVQTGGMAIKLATAPASVVTAAEIPSNAITRPAITGDWWDPYGDIDAGCIAVYKPKGAASLAASYVNLINPGTYDAAPGTAPDFDTATGWTFNGTDQYLDTGIVPAAGWSAVIMYTDKTGTGNIFGTYTSGARFEIAPRTGDVVYGNGGFCNITPALAAGILGIAWRSAYRNGQAETEGTGSWTTTTDLTCYIGNRSGANAFGACKIQALAVYNVALTGAQMEAIYDAMAAQI